MYNCPEERLITRYIVRTKKIGLSYRRKRVKVIFMFIPIITL